MTTGYLPPRQRNILQAKQWIPSESLTDLHTSLSTSPSSVDASDQIMVEFLPLSIFLVDWGQKGHQPMKVLLIGADQSGKEVMSVAEELQAVVATAMGRAVLATVVLVQEAQIPV